MRIISAQEQATASAIIDSSICASKRRRVLMNPSMVNSDTPSAIPRKRIIGLWVWAFTSPGITSFRSSSVMSSPAFGAGRPAHFTSRISPFSVLR